MANDQYLLDHSENEWDRLEAQHRVWRHTLLPTLERHGLRPSARVLEVGCGNGALLRDLAELAGPDGKVVGFEIEPQAVARARQKTADLPWVRVEAGDLRQVDGTQIGQGFDLIVARWVLSFLPEIGEILEKLTALLAPGGHLVVQDYAYDAIRVVPDEPAIRRLFEVTPRAYQAHGGDAWVAIKLPGLFVDAGLELVGVEPHCQAGGPESAIFGWVERFFLGFAGRLHQEGFLTEKERDESRVAWARARQNPATVFFSPLVINVIGRCRE